MSADNVRELSRESASARPARDPHVDHTTVHGATPQLPLWNPRL